MSQYGAGLLIMRSDGRMLLTRRSPLESRPGYWDAPGGGVEAGESHLDAALREGREELGGLPKLEVATEQMPHHLSFVLFDEEPVTQCPAEGLGAVGIHLHDQSFGSRGRAGDRDEVDVQVTGQEVEQGAEHGRRAGDDTDRRS